ncbi:MAG: hypothetical protein AAFU03_02120, partial [Bacteroidota bacterium]
RERQRIAEINYYKEKFLHSPTLNLPFRNMQISFSYTGLILLENFGTIYPDFRVTDDWGVLTVEKGALISENWSKVTLSEPQKIVGQIVEGEGWKLKLRKQWVITESEGGYTIRGI